MVSVIVPCFNGEKFLNRCLNSILEQTYKDLEVILVDDGSTDKSKEIIKLREKDFNKYNMKYIYIYQKNKGPGGAINTGLKYVSRKFITLLDVDDYIMPESIELKLRFLMENSEYDIVRTNGYYVNEDDLNNKDRLFVVNNSEKNNENIFNDLIEAKTNNWAGSYMVRTEKLFEFYKDKNIYESKYGQNLQILLPLSYKGKSGFIDKPLMKYIKQEKSLSQLGGSINFEIENMIGYKNIRKYMVKSIVSKNAKKKYLDIIEVTYARHFMNIAIQYKNMNLLRENYKILKRYNDCRIEDKVVYYNEINCYIAIIFRIIRKLGLDKRYLYD